MRSQPPSAFSNVTVALWRLTFRPCVRHGPQSCLQFFFFFFFFLPASTKRRRWTRAKLWCLFIFVLPPRHVSNFDMLIEEQTQRWEWEVRPLLFSPSLIPSHQFILASTLTVFFPPLNGPTYCSEGGRGWVTQQNKCNRNTYHPQQYSNVRYEIKIYFIVI